MVEEASDKFVREDSGSPTIINCDNQSCIKMCEDLMFHARTKYINNKFHYVRNLV